jgi:hypothetical protein
MTTNQLKLAVADIPIPQHNRLIAALPKADADHLLPHLEPVLLSEGETLIENEGKYQHAYFPTTAIVALVYPGPDVTAQVATIGNDGLVGIPLFLGDGVTIFRAVVHNPGYAYRLDGQLLRREFQRAESLRSILLQYTLTCLGQTVAIASRPDARHGMRERERME